MKRHPIAFGFSILMLFAFASLYAQTLSSKADETFDQKFMTFGNPAHTVGKSGAEIEAMALGILTPDSTPEEKGRVYLYLSARLARDGMPQARTKRIEFLKKALAYPLLTGERLQSYADLGRIQMYEAQDTYGKKWTDHASDCMLTYLQGIKAARDAGVPDVAPPAEDTNEIIPIDNRTTAADSRTPEGQEVLTAIRAERAQTAAKFEAWQERKSLALQVIIKDGLVQALASVYADAPDKFPAIRDEAMKVLEDPEYVDALMKKMEKIRIESQRDWDAAMTAGIAMAKKRAAEKGEVLDLQ